MISGVVGRAGGLGGFFPPLVMGFVRDHTGSCALGFVILAMLAAFCWALLLARSPQRSDSRQAYVKLALATAAFAVAFAAWSMISPPSRQIQADLNLDNTSIGLLIALPKLLGALMRVPIELATAGIDSGLRWPDRCA